MIEVKNITKSFDGRVVLKDISTTFEDGKTNLIIGRSGSGKTAVAYPFDGKQTEYTIKFETGNTYGNYTTAET